MTEVNIPDDGGDTMTMVDVGEFIQPIFLKTPSEIKRIFDSVPNFEFRDDDVMLCTFAKTGTNWMFEILMMVLKRSAQRIDKSKMHTMIESVFAEEADMQPSPRVMNCHFPPRYLPLNDMKSKQIKTVLCLRNPKDTAVSYYNHMRGMRIYNYSGKWENWLPVFVQGKLRITSGDPWDKHRDMMQEVYPFVIYKDIFALGQDDFIQKNFDEAPWSSGRGQDSEYRRRWFVSLQKQDFLTVEYKKYSDYLLEWQKLVKEGAGFPLHIMYYEDLKMNGREELNKLLKFLGIQLDEKLKGDIVEMCGFQKMAVEKEQDETLQELMKKDFQFFRKGEVGDWRNWFTVAQNEWFDNLWGKEAKELDLFEFKYSHDKI